MFTSKCKIKTHLIYVHGSDPLKRGFSNFWKGLDNSDSGSCPEIFNRPPFSQVFHLRPKLLHMHTHIHNHSLFYGLHPHPAGQVLNKYWANGRRNGLPSELSITLLCRLGHEVVCWSLSASNCRVGLEPAKNLGPTCFTSHGSASQGWFGWSQKSWAVASAGSKNSKRPITAPGPGGDKSEPQLLKARPALLYARPRYPAEMLLLRPSVWGLHKASSSSSPGSLPFQELEWELWPEAGDGMGRVGVSWRLEASDHTPRCSQTKMYIYF